MMKKRIQILFGSIALLGMSACGEPYVQPDAPILFAKCFEKQFGMKPGEMMNNPEACKRE